MEYISLHGYIRNTPSDTEVHAQHQLMLAHQTPDPLNYRVGPHPGCPVKSLTVLIYRVGPQPGRGSSVCLTHRTTEKDPRQGSL